MDEEQMYKKLRLDLRKFSQVADSRMEYKQEEVIARQKEIQTGVKNEKIKHSLRYEELVKDKKQLEEEIEKYYQNNKTYLQEPRELQDCKFELDKVKNEISLVLDLECEEAKNELARLKEAKVELGNDIATVESFYDVRDYYEEVQQGGGPQKGVENLSRHVGILKNQIDILCEIYGLREPLSNKRSSPEDITRKMIAKAKRYNIVIKVENSGARIYWKREQKTKEELNIWAKDMKAALEEYNQDKDAFIKKILIMLRYTNSLDEDLDQVFDRLEKKQGIDRKVFEEIDPIIVTCMEKLYDSKLTRNMPHISRIFFENYLQMYNKGAKDDNLRIIYNLKNLSKPSSYFDRKRGRHLSLLEKTQINQKAMLAEELGIAETIGRFRPSFIDRFFERIGVKQIEERTANEDVNNEGRERRKQKKEQVGETKKRNEKIIADNNGKLKITDEGRKILLDMKKAAMKEEEERFGEDYPKKSGGEDMFLNDREN